MILKTIILAAAMSFATTTIAESCDCQIAKKEAPKTESVDVKNSRGNYSLIYALSIKEEKLSIIDKALNSRITL